MVKESVRLGAFEYMFYAKGLGGKAVLTVLLHGFLELTAIIIACAAGIVLGKGFLFPPAYKWAPTDLPKEDEECIAILEDLRSQGADWFGIVDKHFQEISNNRPAFKKYLDNNMKMVKQTSDFVLYKW